MRRQPDIPPGLRSFIEQLEQHKARYAPNPFWDDQLSIIRSTAEYKALGSGGSPDIQALFSDRRIAYGFQDLPNDLAAREDPDLLRILEMVPRLQRDLARVSAKALGLDKDAFEHLTALHFLKKRRMLDGYFDLLAELGVKSSMSTARHYVYARRIAEIVEAYQRAAPLAVCEIGAGAGNLACLLWRRGLVGRYVIVDLPEMLILSAFTVQRYVPDAPLFFNQALDGRDAADGFWFFTPDQVDRLPNGCTDLGININSFMEMDENDRNGYLRLIYRLGRPRSLFININRRQQTMTRRDGSTYDNNPLLYPYAADDQVLHWEVDEFEQARSITGSSRNPAILRAARINA